MKQCSICKELKEPDKFSLVSKNGEKRRAACKKCTNKYKTKRTKIEMKKKGSYEWYRRKYDLKKQQAKIRKIEFLLTFQEMKDLLNQKECYYCELPPEIQTIDRVDNSKPYVINNCVMACWNCNYKKRALSLEQINIFYKKTSQFLLEQKIQP